MLYIIIATLAFRGATERNWVIFSGSRADAVEDSKERRERRVDMVMALGGSSGSM